jgi:hypothetical protein
LTFLQKTPCSLTNPTRSPANGGIKAETGSGNPSRSRFHPPRNPSRRRLDLAQPPLRPPALLADAPMAGDAASPSPVPTAGVAAGGWGRCSRRSWRLDNHRPTVPDNRRRPRRPPPVLEDRQPPPSPTTTVIPGHLDLLDLDGSWPAVPRSVGSWPAVPGSGPGGFLL